MDIPSPFDRYSLIARAFPSLLVVAAPLITTTLLWPELVLSWGTGLTVAIALGLVLLFSQIVRDRGKVVEAILFRAWEGAPTSVRLRHRSSDDPAAIVSTHRALADITGLTLPSAEEERKEPAAADATYARATGILRELTRDRRRFPLVAAANATYGFRRNLFGVRTAGIGFCLLGASVSAVALVDRALDITALPLTSAVAAVLTNGTGLIVWLKTISQEWVRVAGDDYAAQLLAAIHLLGNSPRKPLDA